MRSHESFLIWVIAWVFSAAPAICANAGESTKPIILDEALREAFSLPRAVAICSDSYVSEEALPWGRVEKETDEKRLARLAETFERVHYRAGSFDLLRHERWYDVGFTRARAGDSGKRPQHTRVSRNALVRGNGATLRIETLRSRLSDLCQALQAATGERHAALGWIAERRVTLIASASTSADLRAALERLFVDSRWVKDQETWLLKERPNADRIRRFSEIEANRSRRQEEWAEAGLKTQLVADLSDAEWRTLEAGKVVTLDWDRLSPAARGLLVGWGEAFADTILKRSNGSRGNFADMGRTRDLGVEVRLLPNRMKVTSFGRTTTGVGVRW